MDYNIKLKLDRGKFLEEFRTDFGRTYCLLQYDVQRLYVWFYVDFQ